MDREKTIYFRNLFLRMFVIGIVFAILLLVAIVCLLEYRQRRDDASVQSG